MVPSVRRVRRTGVDDRRHVLAYESDVGGADRRVRAAAHGDAEIGAGEGGGVVDPVADHRDPAALGAQRGDQCGLALRGDRRRGPR